MNRKFFVAFAVLAIVLFSVSIVYGAGGLLPPPPSATLENGSFELGMSDWTFDPGSELTTFTPYGNYAAKVGDGAIDIVNVSQVAVVNGAFLEFDIRTQSTNPTTGDIAYVIVEGDFHYTIEQFPLHSGTNNGWERVAIPVGYLSGQTVTVYLRTFNATPNSHIIVDNVTFTDTCSICQ